MHVSQRRYSLQRQAARCVQSAWRGWSAREKYQKQQRSIVLLQAVIRGWLARQTLRRQHAAALQIQTTWKRHQAQTSFLDQKRMCILLQAAVRGHLLRKRLKHEYTAACQIQASVRGWKVRQVVKVERKAAVTISRAYRAWKAQKSFQSLRRSAVLMQRRVRSGQATKVARKEYQKQRAAAVQLQAATRGWRARQQYKELKAAASAGSHAEVMSSAPMEMAALTSSEEPATVEGSAEDKKPALMTDDLPSSSDGKVKTGKDELQGSDQLPDKQDVNRGSPSTESEISSREDLQQQPAAQLDKSSKGLLGSGDEPALRADKLEKDITQERRRLPPATKPKPAVKAKPGKKSSDDPMGSDNAASGMEKLEQPSTRPAVAKRLEALFAKPGGIPLPGMMKPPVYPREKESASSLRVSVTEPEAQGEPVHAGDIWQSVASQSQLSHPTARRAKPPHRREPSPHFRRAAAAKSSLSETEGNETTPVQTSIPVTTVTPEEDTSHRSPTPSAEAPASDGSTHLSPASAQLGESSEDDRQASDSSQQSPRISRGRARRKKRGKGKGRKGESPTPDEEGVEAKTSEAEGEDSSERAKTEALSKKATQPITSAAEPSEVATLPNPSTDSMKSSQEPTGEPAEAQSGQSAAVEHSSGDVTGESPSVGKSRDELVTTESADMAEAKERETGEDADTSTRKTRGRRQVIKRRTQHGREGQPGDDEQSEISAMRQRTSSGLPEKASLQTDRVKTDTDPSSSSVAQPNIDPSSSVAQPNIDAPNEASAMRQRVSSGLPQNASLQEKQATETDRKMAVAAGGDGFRTAGEETTKGQEVRESGDHLAVEDVASDRPFPVRSRRRKVIRRRERRDTDHGEDDNNPAESVSVSSSVSEESSKPADSESKPQSDAQRARAAALERVRQRRQQQKAAAAEVSILTVSTEAPYHVITCELRIKGSRVSSISSHCDMGKRLKTELSIFME